MSIGRILVRHASGPDVVHFLRASASPSDVGGLPGVGLGDRYRAGTVVSAASFKGGGGIPRTCALIADSAVRFGMPVLGSSLRWM